MENDIKEIYSVDSRDGVTIIIKRDLNDYLRGRDEYAYIPDILINPEIKIHDNGVLEINGNRHTYIKIRVLHSLYWYPTPTKNLNGDWKSLIFFNQEKDIIFQDDIEWSG